MNKQIRPALSSTNAKEHRWNWTPASPLSNEGLNNTHNVTRHKLYHSLLFTASLNVALCNYMQRIPSRESVNQSVNKFLELYGNPKVHYRVYNSPKLVTILCHMNPTHAVPSYFLMTNYNATLQSAPRTPEVVYFLRVSQPKPRGPKHFCSLPSHACHILRPSDFNLKISL